MTDQKPNPGEIEALIHSQLDIMTQQLQMMAGNFAPATGPASEDLRRQSESPVPDPVEIKETQPAGRRALKKTKDLGLNRKQEKALAALIDSYCDRTKESKRLTDEWRPRLADNRTVAGFNALWKEMVYQIVCERSLGSKIWDVDGNEYVDVTLSFGAVMLGHSPDFIVKAVEEQLHKGFEVGLQNKIAGDVCAMICELTGNERVTFSHSGCEAVQYATRIARTATGRDRVVMFTNDIHGRGDLVLGRTVQSKAGIRTVPTVAGVPKHVVADALVLPYGTPETMSIIKEYIGQIAAVLVEPVRTRNPDLQPSEFLHELRQVTNDAGALLVFDEVVMGFRVAPGGAQAHFDIRADLVTYGKALGGGMPIGAVAGKAKYIDVIDGGQWRFGDESFPEIGMTAAGGTMIKHPLSVAAAKAFLSHLIAEGPSLQEELNARTKTFVGTLNDFYQQSDIAIHLESFSSYFLPKFATDTRFEGLFYCLLRNKGVHIYMDYPCFLSTAHSDSDVEYLVAAFQASALEMKAAGFMS